MGFTNDANLDDRSRGMVENRGGLAAFQASYENTWGLVDKLAGSKDLPRFYFAIGKDDFLYESYKTFKAHAKEIGFDATFEEFDGYKHEWRFWDLTIQRALDFSAWTKRARAILLSKGKQAKKRRPALRVCSEAPGAVFLWLRGPRGPGRSRRPPRACGSSGAPSAAGPRPGTGG